MARKIDLSFNDRKYTIEYNRESVAKFMANMEGKDSESTIDLAVRLIECGLIKNHANEVPDRETIISWLFSLGGELQDFVNALKDCVQDVMNIIEQDTKSKNLKWEVRG